MSSSKHVGRSIEMHVSTDAHGARHLQVRIGRAVVATIGQTFSAPLAPAQGAKRRAEQCHPILDIGRGMAGYALGVTLLRRWHVSLTAERVAPGVRLVDDIEGADGDPVVDLLAADLIAAG